MHQSNLPFLQSVVFGYKNYPRGFEYNLIQSFAGIGVNETFKVKLIDRSVNLNFVPIKEFKPLTFKTFAYCFADVAYSPKTVELLARNNLSGEILASVGAGLDFVFYYDRSFGFHFAVTNQNAFGIFATFTSPMYKSIE